MKLPKTVYVQVAEYDKGGFSLSAVSSELEAVDYDLGYAEGGKKVGVYVLKEVVSLKKNESVTRRPAKR